MKIVLALLLLCSTAEAGRRCPTCCAAKYQKQLNRKALIEQGVPQMRAQALLNFSGPFGFFNRLRLF